MAIDADAIEFVAAKRNQITDMAPVFPGKVEDCQAVYRVLQRQGWTPVQTEGGGFVWVIHHTGKIPTPTGTHVIPVKLWDYRDLGAGYLYCSPTLSEPKYVTLSNSIAQHGHKSVPYSRAVNISTFLQRPAWLNMWLEYHYQKESLSVCNSALGAATDHDVPDHIWVAALTGTHGADTFSLYAAGVAAPQNILEDTFILSLDDSVEVSPWNLLVRLEERGVNISGTDLLERYAKSQGQSLTVDVLEAIDFTILAELIPYCDAETLPLVCELIERSPGSTLLIVALASHPGCAPGMLVEFAMSEHGEVRAAVAGNPSTPLRARTLASLA